LSELIISPEALASCKKEAALLALEHFAEVEAGVEPRRAHCVDWEGMEKAEAAGALRVYTARKGGELVGYITWTLACDLESKGLLVAQQGAWFVAPGAALAGWKLFMGSLRDLKSRGVKLVIPHHRLQGRGRGLARWFERLGAKPLQMNYSLWIGD
jgi:hypothetical protein